MKLKDDSPKAKIIDLGLAKGIAESQSETAISIPGSFAGTPEFASPEQFAGINVDIRSDLYSLGITLWEMLTGRTPFRGTPGELMYQQGNVSFAANVLGAAGALLSVLVHFFGHGRWDSPVKMGVEGQSLTAEDQLFILTQAGLYLSVTRGLGAPEARICYERAESLCHSLNRPLLLYSALIGHWRYSLITDKLTATMQIAQRVYSLRRSRMTLRY